MLGLLRKLKISFLDAEIANTAGPTSKIHKRDRFYRYVMHFSHSFYLTVALDVTLNLQPTMTHLGRRVYTAPKSWENSE